MQNIMKKLLEIQKKNVFIPKNGNNPFTKSKYRKLDDILTVMKPILSEYNIVLLQTNENSLCHVVLYDVDSWEEIASTLDVQVNMDPQKVWAAITYFTRYWISWLLGLEVADDTDGEDGKNKKKVWSNTTEWKENRLQVINHIKKAYDVVKNNDVQKVLSEVMWRTIILSEYTEAEAKCDLLTLLK